MKKNILLILIPLLIFFITASPVFSDDSMWMRLYERLDTLEYKHNILESMVDSDDRTTIPVFQRALEETNALILVNTLDSAETRLFDNIQIMVIKKLGGFGVTEAEDAIFQAYLNTTNLVKRTDAITALAQIGSVKYVEDFITTLRNINMRVDSNTNVVENEAIASALVNYFETVRDPSSYEVVFYAAVGWYSPRSGIRDRAREALKVISDDPTDILKNIIENDANFENKFIGLSAGNESSAPDERKSILAVAALNEGIRHNTNTVQERMHLLNLRLLASRMLINSSAKNPEAVPHLQRILFANYDLDEKLTVIEALGTYRSDEAVATLSRYLKDQNDRQAAGMSPYIDSRTVMATITALGNSGNPAAIEELIVVTTIPTWANNVLREARAAIEKLR